MKQIKTSFYIPHQRWHYEQLNIDPQEEPFGFVPPSYRILYAYSPIIHAQVISYIL
jgi:hypothetical protein